MELEDFADEKVGAAVAASAVVFSPAVRRTLRRGLVYGVAGVLSVADSIVGFVRGVRQGANNGRTMIDANRDDQETEAEEGNGNGARRARGPTRRRARTAAAARRRRSTERNA